MNTDPYNWPFPQKQQTMYLSTINKCDLPYQTHSYMRDSSFQHHDIQGTVPRVLAPTMSRQTNFGLSTYVQPIPDRHRRLMKTSDPLKIDDIEGARPRATQFRTKRVVDPLAPKYQLASCGQFSQDPGRNFIRDTLKIDDINSGKKNLKVYQQPKEQIKGSSSVARTKLLNAISRLDVKDINKDMLFQTNRRVDPLNPNYQWRDDDNKQLNPTYGNIPGTSVKQMHKQVVNRPNNYSLNTKDIDGAWSGTCFQKAHFIDKRRQFRNYMNTNDIDKANPSSLKKGIQTKRQVNPLMPNYQFLGHTQANK